MLSKPNYNSSSQPLSISVNDDDDDDFQIPLSQTPTHSLSITLTSATKNATRKPPLKPSNNSHLPRYRPKKKLKPSSIGKENVLELHADVGVEELKLDESCSLDLIESSIDCSYKADGMHCLKENVEKKEELEINRGYLCNSIEARLMKSNRVDYGVDLVKGGLNEHDGCEVNLGKGVIKEDDRVLDFEENNELDALIKLCTDEVKEEDIVSDGNSDGNKGCLIQCPLCGIDISGLSKESRLIHTNDCLDKADNLVQDVSVAVAGDDREPQSPPQVVDGPVCSPQKIVDASPILDWLRNLGLERYEEAFVREEIDWDTLQWLTEEDLFSIGVTALGPRKKIMHALGELRKGGNLVDETHGSAHESRATRGQEVQMKGSKTIGGEKCLSTANKLITDYFYGSTTAERKVSTTSKESQQREKCQQYSGRKNVAKNRRKNGKLKDIPIWCVIPGTPFRVDAFKYLRGDCSHWFLTHFHMDHYQGLTRSFCHGKIYCSLITARLVNMKIGIPWDKLQVLPLNEKINIAGVNVTCLDANHCPGSIIILFEPPNGKNVLHTGDFRFCEEMTRTSFLQKCPINTLILDTTYCNSQYDFPKQDAVIQFVIESIQAQSFNPKTLFLIGSYTIGKERLFLEIARVLRRKVYVTAAKFRLLECLGFSAEDMQWFTLNEHESHIHVVPMWTLASFKRLKHISNHYVGRFNLIVAFSPTGWTFGKGMKKSPGRRWQQGTIIRYEVPYSEHSSFSELREFVKFVSPEKIIPSVNNDGPDSADSMVSLLIS